MAGLQEFSASISGGLAFSHSGEMLAVGWGDRHWPGNISFWDLNPLRFRGQIDGNYMSIHSLAFTPDGLALISASGIGITQNAGQVKVWDLDSLQERATLASLPTSILGMTLSADGHTLATLGADYQLHIWRSATDGDVLSDLEKKLLSGSGDRTAISLIL